MDELTTKQKILKVIQFIYNLLSGLFIGFILTSLIIGGVKSNNGVELPKEEQSSIVETKRKSNIWVGTNEVVFSSGDFFSTQFLYNFVDSQYQRGGDYRNIDFVTQTNFTIYFDAVSDSGTYPGIRPIVNGYPDETKGFDIGQVRLAKFFNGVYSDNNGGTYLDFTYHLAMYSAWGDHTNRLDIAYRVYAYNSYILVPLVNIDYYMDPSNDLSSFLYDFSYIEHSNQRLHPFLDYYVPYLEDHSGDPDYDYNHGYAVGYDEGYDDGVANTQSSLNSELSSVYNVGVSAGYNQGYSQGFGIGYNQGEADYSQGNPYGIFTIIGQAFNSMSAILGIDLLPGLSIGVLLFTPIIILVTIIIFKMFKG